MQLQYLFVIFILDKPGKPGTPSVGETTKTSATLSWQPPENDGGAPITNYVIEYRGAGQFRWQKATDETVPETTYTIQKLKEEQEYEFRVSAENLAGVGPASEISKPVKVIEPIGKLQNLNVIFICEYFILNY